MKIYEWSEQIIDDGDPDGVLPEHSLLSLEQYRDMQRAIGNETRFRILNHLVDSGANSAAALRDALDVESNTLHYHLDTLVDVGLVENRKRTEPDSEGLYSYYRATSLGEGVLTYGVRELVRALCVNWVIQADGGKTGFHPLAQALQISEAADIWVQTGKRSPQPIHISILRTKNLVVFIEKLIKCSGSINPNPRGSQQILGCSNFRQSWENGHSVLSVHLVTFGDVPLTP